MALRFALAALTFGAAVVKAQLTDRSNLYTVSDDYYSYYNTRRSSSTKTSMFWTVTVREMDSVSFDAYTYARTTETYDYTYSRTIKPSVTPTVTPTYTTSTNAYYSNIELHVEYYPTGAVAESDLVPLRTANYYDYSSTASSTRSVISSTTYYMPVTMTAPASCPTVFTVATQATVTDIPSLVTDQLKPTSTDVSTSTYRSYDIVEATWYLTEGAAPFTSTEDYYYSYYIKSCTPPPAQYTGSGRTYGGSGGGSSSSGSGSSSGSDSWTDYRTCYFGGCTTLKVWIIIIATILPGIFLLGFLESFFWYTRLMKGKSAMRGGTVCWVLLSLWVLCFTRMQDARSKEDQKLLQQKWKEMPAGQKFKNWSWGFRRRYPVPLLGQYSSQTVGIVPEGQPLHPAMAQAPAGQVFYYGPPPPGAPGAPGYPMPPQGYPQQQNGYYPTNIPKQGVLVGSSSTSGTVTPPQAPQPVYQPPTSPPPTTQLPPQPKQDAPLPAPPAGVNEAPAQTARAAPAEQAPAATAAESTPAPATTQPQPAHPAPAKNDTNDDLYK
ncbi:hypothetical protein E8E13_008284 [Curvularia kusanoi]|uniref:Uncharacterized protein n=1 Tax=Curvularia kusanoi TaxID=90978 RepID=A0A9P4TLR5_CURKU|nr:hypothetical protein E8E13_008284 [Curvularia kusanoi]